MSEPDPHNGQRPVGRAGSLRTVRKLAWIGVALAAVVIAATFGWREWKEDRLPDSQTSGQVAIRSDFELVDHNGKSVTEEDFRGRWQLVFFGFTHCPDVCPTTLGLIAETLDLLGDDARHVAPLFFSVDPERDTPEVLAPYVAAFHPRLVGLTGTPEQVKAAAKAFRIYYAKMDKQDASDGYLMNHSGYIYLMTPEGTFDSVYFEQRNSAESVATAIRQRLRQDRN